MRQKAASSLTLQQCLKKWQIPRFINTDKAPAYGRALALLKREGRCPSDVEHRQIKYR
ncbi:transposase, partial [Klebsiella pneumoniae]